MSACAKPASARRISKSEFDAALVPGFREATRSAYRDLNARAGADMRATLDEAGHFRPGVESVRDCPLCATPRLEAVPFMAKLGMRIGRCPGCGLIYSANVLEAGYDHQRYVQSSAQTSFEALKRNEAYAALERTKSRYIAQRLTELRPRKGTLFEVGPGAGRLLDAARECGWGTAGIEVNPEFAGAARSAGHQVSLGLFPDDLASGRPFDAMAMLDVLEHLHQPLEALRACRERLAPDGVIIIQVPNVDSLLVRLEGESSLNFCHGHWNHFSPATLARLAQACGLATVHMETIISEIDRIGTFPRERIDEAARATCGEAPPADFDADWLHERAMGYKVLAFLERGDR